MLGVRALGGLLALLIIVAALLFVTAGTFRYWQAWTFLCVYFTSSLLVTLYLLRSDPQLLTRRMTGGPMAEKEIRQRIIMSFASLGFVGLIVVPALDHRFGWSDMAPITACLGDALVVLGWFGIFRVFRANTFAASIIEVAEGQKVVSTGPYARVRHPMYSAGLIMLGGTPVALGSWPGLLVIAVIFPVLVWRLLDEERYLDRKLPGYLSYRRKVVYRLVPLVW